MNTLLNVILIPQLGAMGAAIATMIGYLTVTIIRTISTNKIIRMKISWPIQIMSAVLILIQGIMASLENTTVIQMAVLAIIIYIQRSFIGKELGKVIPIIMNRVKGRNKGGGNNNIRA